MKENKIQSECYQWYNNNFCLKHHNPRGLMFSVPNESISQTTMAIINILKKLNVSIYIIKAVEKTILILTSTAKSMGLVSGVSDTIILLPNGKILFCEFKDEKGKQSENQKIFEQRVNDLGHDYILVRNLESFKDEIRKYNN